MCICRIRCTWYHITPGFISCWHLKMVLEFDLAVVLQSLVELPNVVEHHQVQHQVGQNVISKGPLG